MAEIKLDFRNKSVAEKLLAAQTVITQSTGNTVVPLPAPQPKLTTLSSAHYALTNAANAAAAADQAAMTAHENQDAAEAALEAAYGGFADVVQQASGGDAAKILSTGYAVRAEAPHGPTVLVAPAEFTATAGDAAGEIDVHWDRVPGARSYEVQTTTDPSGATGWTSGAGPWSQVVIKRAP